MCYDNGGEKGEDPNADSTQEAVEGNKRQCCNKNLKEPKSEHTNRETLEETQGKSASVATWGKADRHGG